MDDKSCKCWIREDPYTYYEVIKEDFKWYRNMIQLMYKQTQISNEYKNAVETLDSK